MFKPAAQFPFAHDGNTQMPVQRTPRTSDDEVLPVLASDRDAG
jgi:hypothetical protein